MSIYKADDFDFIQHIQTWPQAFAVAAVAAMIAFVLWALFRSL